MEGSVGGMCTARKVAKCRSLFFTIVDLTRPKAGPIIANATTELVTSLLVVKKKGKFSIRLKNRRNVMPTYLLTIFVFSLINPFSLCAVPLRQVARAHLTIRESIPKVGRLGMLFRSIKRVSIDVQEAKLEWVFFLVAVWFIFKPHALNCRTVAQANSIVVISCGWALEAMGLDDVACSLAVLSADIPRTDPLSFTAPPRLVRGRLSFELPIAPQSVQVMPPFLRETFSDDTAS